MKEEWKDIKGWEGYYMVSNLGNVKSLERTVRNGKGYRTVPERIMKLQKNRNGYLSVILTKDGIIKRCTIHKLVAEAFLPNPQNYKEVNHKDENKENNIISNLEWCDRLYNMTYNGRAKKVGEKLKGRKHSEETIKKIAERLSKPVFSVNKESGLIMWWQSASEAGRILGITKQSICACCKGRKYKSAGGFYWFYADEDDDTE